MAKETSIREEMEWLLNKHRDEYKWLNAYVKDYILFVSGLATYTREPDADVIRQIESSMYLCESYGPQIVSHYHAIERYCSLDAIYVNMGHAVGIDEDIDYAQCAPIIMIKEDVWL